MTLVSRCGAAMVLGLAATTLAALLALPGIAEARTAKAIWGPTRMPDGSSAFPVYKRLGVDVFQIQLVWDRIAPTKPRHPTRPRDPAYAWPETVTEAVRLARRRGIDVAIMVKGSPAWANGGQSSQWAPAPAHYARFLRAASRRYRSVHRWMIWGETTGRPSSSRSSPIPGPARAHMRVCLTRPTPPSSAPAAATSSSEA